MSHLHNTAAVQRKLLQFVGILPFRNKINLQFLLYSINFFNVFILFLYLCWQNSELANYWEGITSFTLSGSILLALAKFIAIRWKIERIKKTFKDLDGISFGNRSREALVVHKEITTRCKSASKLILTCYSFVIGASLSQPLLFWQLMLPSDTWFRKKFDGDFQTWMCHYTFQLVALISVVLTAVLVDTLPAVIMFIIYGQVKSLGYQLKNLPTHSTEAWKNSLKRCFKDYMKILKVTRDFESIFSTVYLFNMAMLCFNLCSSAVATSFMSGTSQLFGFMANFILIFQLFCPCFLGNLILSQSELLKHQLYSSSWYKTDLKKSRQGLIIFMEVLTKPISISFGRIFVLNLETFTEIINIVYRLYALAGRLIEQGKQ